MLKCLPFGASPYSVKYKPKDRKEAQLSRNRRKQRAFAARFKERHGSAPGNFARASRKRQIVESIGGACQLCSYRKCLRNLVFHHLQDNKFSLSEHAFVYRWQKLLPEIRKCILICHNCHGEFHEGLVEAAKIEQANVELKIQVGDFERRLRKLEALWAA